MAKVSNPTKQVTRAYNFFTFTDKTKCNTLFALKLSTSKYRSEVNKDLSKYFFNMVTAERAEQLKNNNNDFDGLIKELKELMSGKPQSAEETTRRSDDVNNIFSRDNYTIFLSAKLARRATSKHIGETLDKLLPDLGNPDKYAIVMNIVLYYKPILEDGIVIGYDDSVIEDYTVFFYLADKSDGLKTLNPYEMRAMHEAEAAKPVVNTGKGRGKGK